MHSLLLDILVQPSVVYDNNEVFFDDIVLKCQQWSGDHTNADGELRENADHPPVYFYLIGWSRRIVLRSVLH